MIKIGCSPYKTSASSYYFKFFFALKAAQNTFVFAHLRHSRAGGNLASEQTLDSRLRGNDESISSFGVNVHSWQLELFDPWRRGLVQLGRQLLPTLYGLAGLVVAVAARMPTQLQFDAARATQP